MPLINMKDMLQHAYERGYAVGAFDLVSLDFLQAIMTAAERTRSPVILSLAESHFEYFDFELLMPAVETAAKRASVPVAIHLDHGRSLDSAIRAINIGCNGVMVDSTDTDFNNNVQITRSIVESAKACGIPVEGELGYVPGVEGEDAERHPGEVVYTTVAEAEAFVKSTGVDFLAVSIGTVHGRMKGKPKLDYQRLEDINNALGIPLVIHGGTGLGDDQFRRLIASGVAKINYYTALSDAAGSCIKENAIVQRSCSYTGMTKNIQNSISDEVERCLHLWGAAGRAAEVLTRSRPWLPVEHVIIYNVEGIDESRIGSMMAEGHRVLSNIPGVREVVIGKAIKKDAVYQYTWLIRFCHASVVGSFREHPDHVNFADKIFRPVAGKRVSIDFQTIESFFPMRQLNTA